MGSGGSGGDCGGGDEGVCVKQLSDVVCFCFLPCL